MENGSLLQEALTWAQQKHNDSLSSSSSSSPFLMMQLFYLPPVTNDHLLSSEMMYEPSASESPMVKELIQIGNHLNSEFQRIDYPWITGGDGPVWGFDIVEDDGNFDHPYDDSKPQPSIHRTNNKKEKKKIPCLTCTVAYGDSVQDEWYAILAVLELSKHMNSRTVIRCIDSEDGQILWIELADLLPDWVDDLHQGYSGEYFYRGGNKNDSEFRGWIRQGQILLLPPDLDSFADTDCLVRRRNGPLTLSSALQRLQDNHHLVELASMSYIEQVLRSKVPPLEELYHRAAVLLPRSVARLFEKRPDLVNLSVSKWMQTAIRNNNNIFYLEKDEDQRNVDNYSTTTTVTDQLLWNDGDWVWTTLKFGRTSYAMLRNATSRKPGWEHPDRIPPQYQSRVPSTFTTSVADATSPSSLYPYAFPMGVRLVVGLEAAVVLCPPRQPTGTTQDCREELWKQTLSELQMNDPLVEDQCWEFPVWKEISKFGTLTSLSYPDSTLAEQIVTALKESVLPNDNGTDKTRRTDHAGSKPPSADQVDDDHWMYLDIPATNPPHPPTDLTQKTQNNANTQVLDAMVQGVQTFLTGQSSLLEGVVTSSRATTDEGIVINPTIFLNLLHATLRVNTAVELQSLFESTKDPFFSSKDYELLDPNRDDSDDEEGEQAHNEMRQVMEAMDEEIQRDTFTRTTTVEEQSHLLANWLKSLEVGGPGPARNVLQELGVNAPNILSADEEEGEDDDNDNDDNIES
jgi:hypothetical protein